MFEAIAISLLLASSVCYAAWEMAAVHAAARRRLRTMSRFRMGLPSRAGVLLDVALALVLGLVGGWITFRHVAAHYAPAATAHPDVPFLSGAAGYYLEDVLSPCVNRFGFQPEWGQTTSLPAWRAFVTRQVDVFPCAALKRVPVVPVEYFSTLHTHLHRAMAYIFRWTGPRLIGFAYYQAIACGVFVALLFGIFRLGMGRLLSIAALTPMMVSPRHLEIALQPLEYAKAPPFAACVLGIGALLSLRLSRGAACAIALATGCAVGVGFGFKTDVMVYAPFGVIAIALFFRDSSGRRGTRWLVLGLYAAGTLIAGLPVARAHFLGEHRSLVPVQILGGMAPGFAAEYTQPSLYDYGLLFDDAYLIAEINSFNQRINGSTEFGAFYSKPIQKGAFSLAFALERVFPADTVLRTYADVLQILQGAPCGLAAALFVIVALFRVDRRLALALLFTLFYMVGYVSLVFAPKHYFHLEFVPWWFLGCAISLLIGMRRPHQLPSWTSTAVSLGAVVFAGAAVLTLARIYQNHQAGKLFTAYIRPDRFESLTVDTRTTATQATLLRPVGVSIDDLHDVAAERVVTDYFMVNVTCHAVRSGEVTAVYSTPAHWRHGLVVPCASIGERWTLLWPVYQRLPDWRFAGFETPRGQVVSINRISRVKDLAAYGILPRLELPDDWTHRSLHNTLNPVLLSFTRMRPRPPAFPPQPGPLPPPAVSWSPLSTPDTQTLALRAPDLNTWSVMNGVSLSAAASGVTVYGNNAQLEYQLMSPPIAVSPHTTLELRVHGRVEQGRVGVGIIDGSQQHWLLPPGYGHSDFLAETGSNTQVRIVFANMKQPADGDISSRFVVQSVSYDLRDSILDRVSTALWPEY